MNAYNLLNQVQFDRADGILNNFIPNSTLLYSKKDLKDAVYVWTEYDYSGITFEEYLSLLLKDRSVPPAVKVKNILECIITLTKCIGYLHSVGLLHNDIKSSNFLLLYDANGKINTQAISLFDINSITRLHEKSPRISVSSGYTAPEVKRRGKTSISSDIYSIGVMLLNSFVVKDNLEYRYKEVDYKHIKQILEKSSIIFNIPLPFLVHEFIEELELILKNTLYFSRYKRYKDCMSLNKDLNNLLVYLMDEVSREEAEDIVKHKNNSLTNSHITDKLAKKYNIKTSNYNTEYNSSKNHTLTLIDDNGEEESVEIIFSFEFSDNHREFMIYTKYEEDAFDNITLYASRVIREKTGPKLLDVSDEDWPRIVDLLHELGQ